MLAAGWAVPTAVVAVAAAGAATLTAPGAAGLGGRYGWTQLISFRAVLGLGGLAGGLALIPIGRGLRGHRRAAATAAGLAAVGLASAAGQLAVLRSRGYRAGDDPYEGPLRAGPPPGGDGDHLTVVVANALHSSADPGALVAVLLRAGADVVAMPETDPVLAGAVAAGMAAAGRPMQVFGTPTAGEVAPTALLVSAALGEYERVVVTAAGESAAVGATGAATHTMTAADPGTAPPTGMAAGPDVGPDGDFAPGSTAVWDRGAGAPGTVLVRPRDPAGPGGPANVRPVFAAVHPYPPRSRSLTRVWQARSAEVLALFDTHPDAVVAGDFNATLDHPALRAAVRGRRPVPVADAAQQAGAAAVGTWPSSRPAWIGTPIDHVLFDARAWQATSVRVEHLPGSDHRALIARLEAMPARHRRTPV